VTFRTALTIPAAALRLNVSERTIRRWMASGRLRGVETEPESDRVPGRLWIPLSSIEAVEAERREK
jgi:transposase